MKFHVLTLFPEMIEQGLGTSITGRAIENGSILVNAVNIRDYTKDKHKKVDDYTYGGGAGMLMQAQPVYDACMAVKEKAPADTRVIYVTPQGRVFNQSVAEELAGEEELIFLCGHYEGIDERVLEEVVTDYMSIGDYVLTGGELPAMVMMDAVSRLVPEVLHNEESAEIESFHNHLLEYPQYSRPEIWHKKAAPKVLLSGNHKKIKEWRLKESIKRTKERRPDLYEAYEQTVRITEALTKADKLLYADITECLRSGRGELLYAEEDGILIREKNAGIYFPVAETKEAGERLLAFIQEPKKEGLIVSHQEFMNEILKERLGAKECSVCNQAVYTRGVPLPTDKKIEIRLLDESYLPLIMEKYHMADDEEYIRERLLSRVFYGAFIEGKQAGFIGMHSEGSMGMLEVFPEYQRQGIAAALEADCINRLLVLDKIPYCHIIVGNHASYSLQEKLGLRICKEKLWWFAFGC